MASSLFRFKRFELRQEGVVHPAGTDSVLLGAWTPVSRSSKVLDVGTGTGIVALMLAQRTEASDGVRITGIELDLQTAVCAADNFARSPWRDRLELWEGAVQDYAARSDGEFDLIVSNPPFFSETVVSPDPRRRIGRNTNTLSADALLDASRALLAPEGRFCVILPPQEARRLCELSVQKGLYCTRETRVYARPGKPAERMLLTFERRPHHFERDELMIYAAGEQYSAGFQALTRDFYLFL